MWLFLDYGFVNEYEKIVDYHICLLQDIIVNQELKHGFLLMNDIKLMYIYKLVVVQQLWGLFQNTCTNIERQYMYM